MAANRAELLRLLREQHALLQDVATGTSIASVDDDYRTRRDRLFPVLREAELADPFPWRDLWAYWREEAGPLSTYAERRRALDARITPAEEFCLAPDPSDSLQDWNQDDAAPPSWDSTLRRLKGMKSRFDEAAELDDFQEVARRCREIIIDATDLVHKPWMVAEGQAAPQRGNAKDRMEQICSALLRGPTFEHLRGVLKKTLALAQHTTHAGNATRLEAMAAAQSTLMVVLTLRELERMAEERAEISADETELPPGDDQSYSDYVAEFWPDGVMDDDGHEEPADCTEALTAEEMEGAQRPPP